VHDANTGASVILRVPITISGGTATAESPGAGLTAPGTYYWVAVFSGDANNASVSSGWGDEPVTITPGGSPALAGPLVVGTGSNSNTGGNRVPIGAGAIVVRVPVGPAAVSTTTAVSAALAPPLAGPMVVNTGAATLNAGAGGDILIGGWTNYDLSSSGPTYDQKLASLEAIMAEWGSTNSYARRLNKLASSLNTTTVHDNLANGVGVVDTLSGNKTANDWFFAGLNDVVGKNSNDVTVTIK
jgi:hypothetical protein